MTACAANKRDAASSLFFSNENTDQDPGQQHNPS